MSELVKRPSRVEVIEHTDEKGTAKHQYRVTHYLDEAGKDTGNGKIELQEQVEGADGEIELKWRRTGGDYQAFLYSLITRQAQDHAAREYAAAVAALEEKRAELLNTQYIEDIPVVAPPPVVSSRTTSKTNGKNVIETVPVFATGHIEE